MLKTRSHPNQGRYWVIQPSSVAEANMRITALQLFLALCVVAGLAFIRDGHAWAAIPAALLWLLLAAACVRLVMFAFSRPDRLIARADAQGLYLPLSTPQWLGFWPTLHLDTPIAWSELSAVHAGQTKGQGLEGGTIINHHLDIQWRDGRKKRLPAHLFDERVCEDIAATANAAIAGTPPVPGAQARLRIRPLGWLTLLASLGCGIALSLLTVITMRDLPLPWHLTAAQLDNLKDGLFGALIFLVLPSLMPEQQASLVTPDGNAPAGQA